MGNILITALSIFIPITIHTSIIPTLMRPDILGGTPWSPPSMLTYVVLYYSMMYFILWISSFIANIYYSLFNCQRTDPLKSAIYANYTPVIALIVFIGTMFSQRLLNFKVCGFY